MAEPTPPKQVKLDLAAFPKEPWAQQLVTAFNQLSLQTTQALQVAAPKYKDLVFKTGAVAANSFPIDVTLDFKPSNVSVAQVTNGATTGGTVIQWQLLSLTRQQSQSGNFVIRVSRISGLLADTSYSIRLALV